jgi:hypothetical protein
MIENLELGLYPGAEGDESDVESEEENEVLITPKKKRVQQHNVVIETGENDDEESNEITLRSLRPKTIRNKGSKIRHSMIKANEEIERVRKVGNKVAVDGGKRTVKGQGKGKATMDGDVEHLNVKDKKWEKIFWEARQAMGDGDPSELGGGCCTRKKSWKSL